MAIFTFTCMNFGLAFRSATRCASGFCVGMAAGERPKTKRNERHGPVRSMDNGNRKCVMSCAGIICLSVIEPSNGPKSSGTFTSPNRHPKQ